MENPTPPILMEILYAGKQVDWPIKFVACGDGLELVALAGVTSGFCYKCELKYINPSFGRGQKFSRHEISFFGETMELEKAEPRSLKKANKYSKIFHDSKTKNLTERRTENFNYEKKPVYQFSKSIEETIDPELHTVLNIASKRVYNRGLEYCRLQDAQLLENEIAQPNQASAFERYCKTLPNFTEVKQNYETQILQLNETISKVGKEHEKNEKVQEIKGR